VAGVRDGWRHSNYSLEKTDVQADPTGISGKADMAGSKSEDYAQLLHRGSGGSTYNTPGGFSVRGTLYGKADKKSAGRAINCVQREKRRHFHLND